MILTVTLSDGSLPGLDARLAKLGLTARRRPLLHLREVSDSVLVGSLGSWSEFEAIVLTSPRGGDVLRRLLSLLPTDRLPVVWVAGPQTRVTVPECFQVRQPGSGTGAQPLADSMIAAGVKGPVLYLCSAERREELPRRLRASQIEVVELHGYDVELAGPGEVRLSLAETDLILIASHRVLRLAASQLAPGEWPGLICLGPATARTAEELGWIPAAVAREPTVSGVLEAAHSLPLAVPGPQSSPSKPSSGR